MDPKSQTRFKDDIEEPFSGNFIFDCQKHGLLTFLVFFLVCPGTFRQGKSTKKVMNDILFFCFYCLHLFFGYYCMSLLPRWTASMV